MNKKKKIRKILQKSPINYFSDQFVFSMVIAWILALLIMTIAAFYSMIALHDTSIWTELGNLVAIPLTAGGAIWMVKNSVQHANMNYKGKSCPHDFPAVNVDGENDDNEEPISTNSDDVG